MGNGMMNGIILFMFWNLVMLVGVGDYIIFEVYGLFIVLDV